MTKATYKTIDDYFATCSEEVVLQLAQVRKTVQENAPEAIEKIAWGMPTFFLNGNLVHFFAHKTHIGFYPGASGIAHFQQEFIAKGYGYSKGAVKFPLNQPMPLELIADITAFRVKENETIK